MVTNPAMRLTLLSSIFFLSVVVSLALSLDERKAHVYQFVEEWHLWKNTHGKNYDSHLEELEKHMVWLSNRAYVEHHNVNARIGFYSYHVKLNHFADLTDQEYYDQYLTYKRTDWNVAGREATVKLYVPPELSYWPDSIDWRRKRAVTDVKNQVNCGSSYAFATAGALEGAYSLTFDRDAEALSEQNIIDCSVPEGNNGCKGGNMYNSFMYIIFNDGIDSDSSYSYQGMQTPCNFTYNSVIATMSGIIVITSGSEFHLQSAVAYTGPVAAAIDAQNTGFRDESASLRVTAVEMKFYSQGVFDSSRCSNFNVNHAMLVVGYGTTRINGITKDYWILKNSWGDEWGQSGYVLMSRNSYNQCGIASDCSYPSL